jgi:SAM-dependent methyltransferase
MKSRKSISPDLEEIIPVLVYVWRKFHKESGPPDRLQTREFRGVVEAVKKMWDGLENGDELITQDYFKDRNLLGAYILYFWVLHYQMGLSLMGELPIVPKKVLDLCSGPMAFSVAALRSGSSDVTAVDRNALALELGSEICGRYGLPVKTITADVKSNPRLFTEKYDLIILGYCLNELFPTSVTNWREQQKTYLGNLIRKLTPQGHLLIVDSSMGEFNKRILELRDELVKDGFEVQAPCIWKGECPALKANSQCYAQRELDKPYLIKEIQRAAEINQNSLKMSYLIMRSQEAGWPQLPDHNMYRVISPPIETYHGKSYFLCGTDGKKKLDSHLKEHPKESRAFEYIKRGELVSFRNALESGNQISIVQDTEVVVEAPCGKPIPEIIDEEQT